MDWKQHFSKRPALFQETDFFRQVEKTVNGQPISLEQFSALLTDIFCGLNIQKDDAVLDLCCGNGIVTKEISRKCLSVIGIDFSEPLIKIAKKFNEPENVRYYCMSVLDEEVKKVVNKPCNKILMYEGLQFFQKEELSAILDNVLSVSTPLPMIFIGGVPDLNKLWDFYNTEERRKDYHSRILKGNEAIGTWWDRKYINEIGVSKGFNIEFLKQNPLLHTAHYRFNIRLTKN